MGRHSVIEPEEVGARYHHGITKAAVVGCVLDLLGEDIGGIDDARDVGDESGLVRVDLADFVLA